jgi:hypothetical protein
MQARGHVGHEQRQHQDVQDDNNQGKQPAHGEV